MGSANISRRARTRRDPGLRAAHPISRGWQKGVFAMILLAILGAWQGVERRPISAASGTELSPAPVANADGKSADRPENPTGADSALPQAVQAAGWKTIRIGTYNIHSGIGTDRHFDLTRIARILHEEDVVGLNEVRGGSWLAPTSQAELLAAELRSPWLFAPTEMQWGRAHFGNGLLCRRPISEWKRVPLPGTRSAGHRNVLIVTLAHPRKPLTLMITHLDRTTDRALQLREVEKMFLALPTPVVLLGDLNTRKDDPLMQTLLDADDVHDPLKDHLGTDPAERIDWILTRGLRSLKAGMDDAGPSDHPHFWAELDWPQEGAVEPGTPDSSAKAQGVTPETVSKSADTRF